MFKKAMILGTLFFLLASGFSFAQTAGDVTKELIAAGKVTSDEAKAIEEPVNQMLEQGVTPGRIKETVSRLKSHGLGANELKTSLSSMNDLVKQGKSSRSAGIVVTRAAAQAKKEGLSGADLSDKVQEAAKEAQQEKTRTSNYGTRRYK